jgi:hypothetical protein
LTFAYVCPGMILFMCGSLIIPVLLGLATCRTGSITDSINSIYNSNITLC